MPGHPGGARRPDFTQPPPWLRVRLFVGAPVPGADALQALAADLKAHHPDARLVPDGSWHVTLRFLGEVADEDANQVAASLRDALSSATAVPVSMVGVGAFPKPSAARVAWAAMDAPGLDRIASAVVDATRAFGQPPDRRRFVPHVTLARFRQPSDIRPWIDRHRTRSVAKDFIDQVILFHSQLGPQGPTYRHLAEVKLAPPTGGE